MGVLCACGEFLCFCWRNTSSSTLSIFFSVFFLLLSSKGSLYTGFYIYMIYKYFLPFGRSSCQFLENLLWCTARNGSETSSHFETFGLWRKWNPPPPPPLTGPELPVSLLNCFCKGTTSLIFSVFPLHNWRKPMDTCKCCLENFASQKHVLVLPVILLLKDMSPSLHLPFQ